MTHNCESISRLVDYLVVVGAPDDAVLQPVNRARVDSVASVSPITGVALLFPNKKGDCPKGYRKIATTIEGNSGSCNAGATYGESKGPFVCVSYSKSNDPITGIIVRDQDEQKDFESHGLTPGGYVSVEGNLNQGKLGHTVRMFLERDPNKDPIIDIILVNLTKKEKPRKGYAAASWNGKKTNLNAGSSRNQLYIYFKTRPKDYFTRTRKFYKPQLLQRYPMTDWEDGELMWEHISRFCFPRGIELSNHFRTDENYTFVLKLQNGDMYGACLIIYEEKKVRSPATNEIMNIWMPKGLCLLSHWGFYSNFETFLRQLYRICYSPKNPIPLEIYIASFFKDVPLPLCGHPGVKYSMGAKELIFSLPPRFGMPLMGFNLEWLFKCLSIPNVVTVFGLVLAERKIVLTSRHYQLCTPVAEALRSLIYPFKWPNNYPFVPVLPEEMKEYLQAMMPFIFGMHRSFHHEIRLEDGIITVDLDRDLITVVENGIQRDISNVKSYLGKIPDVLREPLEKNLKQHSNVFAGGCLEDIDNLENLGKGIDDDSSISREFGNFEREKVRVSFLQFWVVLLTDYRKYLEYKDTKGLGMGFRKKDFLFKIRPSSVSMWMQNFLKTQFWATFIEEKGVRNQDDSMDPENDELDYTQPSIFFDWCIAMYKNLQGPNRQLPTDLFTTRLEQHLNPDHEKKPTSSYFIAPSALDSYSEKPKKCYSYNSFPTLDLKLIDSHGVGGEQKSQFNDEYFKNLLKRNGQRTKRSVIEYLPKDLPLHPFRHRADMWAKSDELMEEEKLYETYLNRSIEQINEAISRLDNVQSIDSSFPHMRAYTLTMHETKKVIYNKVMYMWFVLFSRYSIDRLSYFSVSPKRDFLNALNQLHQILLKGFFPTAAALAGLVIIPAHCAMWKELSFVHRLLVRLKLEAPIELYNEVFYADAKRCRDQYTKFDELYTKATTKELKDCLPRRNELRFEPDPDTMSYPYIDSLQCSPESLLDYDTAGLPEQILLHGTCPNVKFALTGEEIISGFVRPAERKKPHMNFGGKEKEESPRFKRRTVSHHGYNAFNESTKALLQRESVIHRHIKHASLSPYGRSDFQPVLILKFGRPLEEARDKHRRHTSYFSTKDHLTIDLESPESLETRVQRLCVKHHVSTLKHHNSTDRPIQIIRSKTKFFWNLFFYFNLFDYDTEFLIGGLAEFTRRGKPRFVRNCLPQHTWALELRDSAMGWPMPMHVIQREDANVYTRLARLVNEGNILEACSVFLDEREVNKNKPDSAFNLGMFRQIFVMNKNWGRYSYSSFSKKYKSALNRLRKKGGLIDDKIDSPPDSSFLDCMQDILLLIPEDGDRNGPIEHSRTDSSTSRTSPASTLPSFHQTLCSETLAALSEVSLKSNLHLFVPRLRDILCDPELTRFYRLYFHKTGQQKKQKYLFFMEYVNFLHNFRTGYPQPKTVLVPTPSSLHATALLIPSQPVVKEARKSKKATVESQGKVLNLDELDVQGEQLSLPLHPEEEKLPNAGNEQNEEKRSEGVVFTETTVLGLCKVIHRTFYIPKEDFFIPFSDETFPNHVQSVLVDQEKGDYVSYLDPKNYGLFDDSWNAVFRYIHQNTYPGFVKWAKKTFEPDTLPDVDDARESDRKDVIHISEPKPLDALLEEKSDLDERKPLETVKEMKSPSKRKIDLDLFDNVSDSSEEMEDTGAVC